MPVLFGVLPWIVYAVVSSFVSVAPAVAVAGAVALVLTGMRLARGVRPAELTIDLTTAVVFLIAGGIAVADGPLVANGLGVASQFALAAVVGVGLLSGRPFTEAIARRQVTADVAALPEFHAFNVRISTAWLLSFLVGGLILLLAVLILGAPGRFATYVVVPLAIAVPVRYTAHLTRGVSDVGAVQHN
ncbi:hypothetical protein P0W64_16055 [Tsukamurella sp. 8F]|uniref:hypothetical protein n=1 Tax=unclassified Tsukamurella TaxID=2633480 RepID=UPI0023BA292D|nr:MULTISPECIES: hypothetical protein [unclassified Tsukamurella]MDF0530969.1 hypothetical protein [Tsukamurella sp. 8J]MDF0588294.1 hypothetical protein [Tsukamurella sp. 8F]